MDGWSAADDSEGFEYGSEQVREYILKTIARVAARGLLAIVSLNECVSAVVMACDGLQMFPER